MWDAIFELLFGWWWYGKGGREKTADASDTFLLPGLILVIVVGLIVLFFLFGK